MKTIRSKIQLLLFSIIFVVTCMSTSVTAEASDGYNATAALQYAQAHWNDEKGLCAEFVSDCIKAGGCTAWNRGCTSLRKQLLNTGWGVEYDIVLNSDKSITVANYAGKLSPGDVVFYYCTDCTNDTPYKHAVLCNGPDANGYMRAYQHNPAVDGTKKYRYSSTCYTCGKNMERAKVYHFTKLSSGDPGEVYGKISYNNVFATSITDTTALVRAEVSSDGTLYKEVGLRWGTTEALTEKFAFDISKNSILTFVQVAFDGSEGPTLSKGTTYYYRFYAIRNDGTVDEDSIIRSFTTTGDSQKPIVSDVQVSNVSSTGYTVQCTVTDNVGMNRVCYPTWTENNGQDDLRQDWYDYAVAHLVGNNRYEFRVNTSDHNNEIGKYITHIYAYDNSGNYVIYDMSVDVPAPIVKPATPAKPYKIVNTVSGIHVYWKSTSGISKYALWRSESGTEGSYTKVAETSAVHYTDTKVVSGKTYYYKVTNYDTANKLHSDMSAEVVTTFVSTPDITDRMNLSSGIKLTWNKSEGATDYAIYRKVGSESWGRVKTISGNSTFTWIDNSVKDSNGTTYKYTIRALTGSNKNILSGCRNTGRTMVRLTSRTMTQVKKTAATSVTCKWMTTSQATGYEVRFMVGDTKYKQVTIGNYKTGTKTITGIKAGQTYKVQVRSYKKVDGVGAFYSAWSTPMYVTM